MEYQTSSIHDCDQLAPIHSSLRNSNGVDMWNVWFSSIWVEHLQKYANCNNIAFWGQPKLYENINQILQSIIYCPILITTQLIHAKSSLFLSFMCKLPFVVDHNQASIVISKSTFHWSWILLYKQEPHIFDVKIFKSQAFFYYEIIRFSSLHYPKHKYQSNYSRHYTLPHNLLIYYCQSHYPLFH